MFASKMQSGLVPLCKQSGVARQSVPPALGTRGAQRLQAVRGVEDKCRNARESNAMQFVAKSEMIITTAAMMPFLMPLEAQAAMTMGPSLKNLFYSLVAGFTVLGIVGLAVTSIANFDPLKRD